MQVAFYLAGEITQVKESIPWVRCASGNVFRKGTAGLQSGVKAQGLHWKVQQDSQEVDATQVSQRRSWGSQVPQTTLLD